MEETKRKEIEEKLYQLLLQTDKKRNKKSPARRTYNGARIIRRRKGQPDLQIA